MTIQELDAQLQRLSGRKEGYETQLASLTSKVEALESERNLLQQCLELLSKAASVSREEIKQKIENIVSFSLQKVFERDDYRFELVFERKRGQIETVPVLHTKHSSGHPLDSNGGGVVDLISTVLRLAVKHRLQVPGPMIMDEPAKWLGGTHRPYFMAMLKEFSSKTATQMIFCSHIDEYIREVETAIRVELHEGTSKVSNVS